MTTKKATYTQITKLFPNLCPCVAPASDRRSLTYKIEKVAKQLAVEYLLELAKGETPDRLGAIVRQQEAVLYRKLNDRRANRSAAMMGILIDTKWLINKALQAPQGKHLKAALLSRRAEQDRKEQAEAAAEAREQNAPLGRFLNNLNK